MLGHLFERIWNCKTLNGSIQVANFIYEMIFIAIIVIINHDRNLDLIKRCNRSNISRKWGCSVSCRPLLRPHPPRSTTLLVPGPHFFHISPQTTLPTTFLIFYVYCAPLSNMCTHSLPFPTYLPHDDINNMIHILLPPTPLDTYSPSPSPPSSHVSPSLTRLLPSTQSPP